MNPLIVFENECMAVKTEPKERLIIRMLRSACDNGTWWQASLESMEQKQDGAVEVTASRADGTRLDLEHTLIQPFVREKGGSCVVVLVLEGSSCAPYSECRTNPMAFGKNQTRREIAIKDTAVSRLFESFGTDYCDKKELRRLVTSCVVAIPVMQI